MNLHRFLALLLCVHALSAADVEAAKPAATVGDANGTVIITLSGSLPLRPGGGFLFGDSGMSLHDATALLKRAVTAPERRIVLDCSLEFAPGLTAAEELAAVLRERPARKTVACLIDNASDAVMAMAAACDEVVMVEAGMLNLDGMSMTMDYYADALNRVGVKFFAVTSGEAKTAPEPFTKSRPSETAIAEHERLIDALDKATRELVVRPGFSVDKVAAARAMAPQTAVIAQQLNLVTAAAEPGAWLASQPQPVRRLKKESDTPNISNIAGLYAMINDLLGGQEKKRTDRRVAVVELEGNIIDGDVSMPGYTIGGSDTARLFDKLAGDANVVGVVVRINSGGGSAGASDRAYHALRRLAGVKPVVALFDSVCASGGYYIGCAAREIFVHRATITGSIGVFAMVPELDGTRALFGVNRHTIRRGERSDLFSTGTFTPEKEAAIRQVVKATDDRFQGIVSQQRNIPLEEVHKLAGGRVFSGDEAVANRLADRVGTLTTAVARVRELAGVAEPLPLERLPKVGGFAAKLGLGVGVSNGLVATLPRWLQAAVGPMTQPRIHIWAWSSTPVVE